ncbi:redoxin domain-containing protein [Singulisphaera acidiphila]|uniref:Peroxiredoxin n=1 Tax=Singulisphaera acidiphila (strain ATCC BAA-1392 / DSM 18658 / VKM B-2454 / MOB10) TaxID=886293 RepID=L0DN27_SINAD|nr:redoxin domain-containing protein [Singulisphaera acidiphila]AGA30076.1 Peroxiredoxin [Singulisphaera acidiphila DSM 18658]
MHGSAYFKWSMLGVGLVCLAMTSSFAGSDAVAPVAEVALPTMRGPDGQIVDLTAPQGGFSTLIFYSSECPISNAYSPLLNRLRGEFPTESVKIVGVCVDPDLSPADVLAHAKDFELKFPVVQDRKGSIATKLGASVTPEAFVVDERGRIRYHGRIDDQFAARQKKNANPKVSELHDAISAVLAKREVAIAHVPAVGCPIPKPEEKVDPPTYAGEVASILQKNCQECHRRGQVGPFALETYEQARKRADDIATIAEERKMPPWKPDPHVGPGFKNDRSLSTDEIATLAAWAEAGAPQGDPERVPPSPEFSDSWALGAPDLVLELTEDFTIPASGDDIYRCFVLPTRLPEDVYVSAIEYRPGNRRVVHHMLSYVDVSGEGRKKDNAEPGQGYSCFSGPGVEIDGDLGGWAPGNEPSHLPEGIGRSLPSQADVIVQIHYHPSGKPETDRSRIGLHFSKKPVRQTLHWNAAIKFDLKIPANEGNYKVEAAWPVPVDLEAWAVTPHMHLLGKNMSMSLKFPDGRTQDLIRIGDWDFGWQNTYFFKEPITLPKGTLLKVSAHFDNSADNPRNPNHPPKDVTWGEATTDEMCIGFIAVTKKGQDLTRAGEKDDLHDLFKEQMKEFEKKMREQQKKSQKPVAN